MALDAKDLKAIEDLIVKHLKPIQDDISSMKVDLNLLAKLNQLDDIRKEPRLRKLYEDREEA